MSRYSCNCGLGGNAGKHHAPDCPSCVVPISAEKPDIRETVNNNSPEHHKLCREILGIDWFDCESQARRVIDWMVNK